MSETALIHQTVMLIWNSKVFSFFLAQFYPNDDDENDNPDD